MPVVRDYRCRECKHVWQVFHASSDDPVPDCPHCEGRAAWQPGGFAIKSNAARAGDMAQQMLHEDFGLAPSEINDNQREGDIAFKKAPVSKEVRDQDAQIADVTRQIKNEMEKAGHPVNVPTTPAWGGQARQRADFAQVMAGARQATQQANSEGVNPMLVLKKAAEQGSIPTKARVMTDKGEIPYTIGKNMFGG